MESKDTGHVFKRNHRKNPQKRDLLMEELLCLGAKFLGNVKKKNSSSKSVKKEDVGQYFREGKKGKFGS